MPCQLRTSGVPAGAPGGKPRAGSATKTPPQLSVLGLSGRAAVTPPTPNAHSPHPRQTRARAMSAHHTQRAQPPPGAEEHHAAGVDDPVLSISDQDGQAIALDRHGAVVIEQDALQEGVRPLLQRLPGIQVGDGVRLAHPVLETHGVAISVKRRWSAQRWR